jgi:hypothetical protein
MLVPGRSANTSDTSEIALSQQKALANPESCVVVYQMHAAGEHGPKTHQAHRMAQAWQLANAIRAAAERGRYVIAVGPGRSIAR